MYHHFTNAISYPISTILLEIKVQLSNWLKHKEILMKRHLHWPGGNNVYMSCPSLRLSILTLTSRGWPWLGEELNKEGVGGWGLLQNLTSTVGGRGGAY